MLAVAGAGKTYYICHEINPKNKNLILAFTHENINNIKRELIAAHGYLPELTNVMTFDSFVYRYILCPYEPSILQHFGQENFVSRGITTVDPPSQNITKNGRTLANPFYVKREQLEHYVSKSGRYYCDTLSELVMQVKHGRDSLIKKAATAVNMFYDQVMIDEFQDFREHDYDLITALGKQIDNILLVGDFYQHSVSATNNSGKPFKKGKQDVGFNDFKQELIKKGFKIDETTLKCSRRCCNSVCDYVKAKLHIDIASCNITTGKVFWVDKETETILDDDSIVKLVYNDATNYSFRAVNWSYSKGDTMENVCVILTKKFRDMNSENFDSEIIPLSTKNKLYVAMTRTKGNLYLVTENTFQPLKKKYWKK